MKELIEMLKAEKFMWEGSEMRSYSWPAFLIELSWLEITSRWKARKCKKAHTFVETGGNPESGSFEGHCENCGMDMSGYW